MSDEIKYKNNPLNGVSLKKLLTELSGHYGFDILFAYLNINCFKTNPSVDSSVKFLKKTDWAREKVEAFYIYQFKSYPRVSSAQFKLPPRDRIIADDQFAGEPAELSLEDAEILRAKVAEKAAEYTRGKSKNKGKGANYSQRKTGTFNKQRDFSEPQSTRSEGIKSRQQDDPWASWKKEPK
jgi:uncharacterized protein (DUF2132 family)